VAYIRMEVGEAGAEVWQGLNGGQRLKVHYISRTMSLPKRGPMK